MSELDQNESENTDRDGTSRCFGERTRTHIHNIVIQLLGLKLSATIGNSAHLLTMWNLVEIKACIGILFYMPIFTSNHENIYRDFLLQMTQVQKYLQYHSHFCSYLAFISKLAD